MTEGLLLDLQVNFPGDVLIVPFTKKREARIGAGLGLGVRGPRRALEPGDAGASEAPR